MSSTSPCHREELSSRERNQKIALGLSFLPKIRYNMLVFMSFFSNLFSPSNEAVVNQYQKIVDQINKLEKEFEGKSQDQLKELTAKWKSDLAALDLDQQKSYL